ncbi:DUF6044 family protein [Mongoliitalea daihaiensis]|uniref:DUF6044 family protein n=1 Tax=Mongoliitalea daihaiensis TaxID=2782006 RepID=UPI001F1C0F42|nr:DUF6044 family protein [Mongoliitalea daihaiensis]UJP64157.1 hypothetical protein IPZ59_15250 [Mongoliitalea daihaiensis]
MNFGFERMIHSSKKNIGIQLFSVILMCFIILLPYILLGDGVHIIISDNLDSNIVWLKTLVSQGKLWSLPNTTIEGFLIETPRFSFPSGLNGFALLYYLPNTLVAYAIQKAVIVCIAFFSMYVWLEFFSKNGSQLERILIACIWASLVFYPHRGISLASIPLLGWLYGYYKSRSLDFRAFILLLIYGFFSMPLLSGMYVWAGFLCYLFIKAYQEKKFHRNLWLLQGIWLLIYLIQEYHYIYQVFIPYEFVSHRSEFSYYEFLWKDWNVWTIVLQGDYSGIVYSFIYPLIAIGAVIYWIVTKSFQKIHCWLLVPILLLMAFCWTISKYFSWDIHLPSMDLLPSLNLLRFNHWIPFLIFSIVGLWLLEIKFWAKKMLLLILIGMNIFVYHYEWRHSFSYSTLLSPFITPSFKEYYAEEQYEAIKEFIGPDWKKKRIAHVNLPPAVSVYNGFLTLDGYLQNYSLDYKHLVGKVISNEIAGNTFLEWQFWRWGNKCYFQNKTYPDDFMRYHWVDSEPISSLSWDFTFLKLNLNADFILASVPLEVSELLFLNSFEHPYSAWKIYLYSIR